MTVLGRSFPSSSLPNSSVIYSAQINFPYTAPSFLITPTTVFQSIFTSTPKLHSSIYFVSNLTTSSKSVILLLPLTCQSPVRPGRNDIRALWCGLYWFHSSSVGGLVPANVNIGTTFFQK